MEGKSTLKITPLKFSLLILLLIVVAFIGLQLIGRPKSKHLLVSSQITKEVSVPATVEKPKLEEKPLTDLEKKFTIQVASFQDKARADILVEDLRKKGYAPTISAKDLGEKGTRYRVEVGEFESEEKTREILNTLKEHYKDSFIKLK